VPVTEDEVTWCYRNILGREPESPGIVGKKTKDAADFRTLVLSFLRSPEYLRKKVPLSRVPQSSAEMHVETLASADELASIRRHIRAAWTHLGEHQPHFSVLTAKEFSQEHLNDQAIAQFYASGVSEAASVMSILDRFGFSHPESKTCVEYGSGLGRLTLALAKSFHTVHGYDISANHLALAEKRAEETGLGNVHFHLCSTETETQIPEPCDFLYSRIVLQHNPPPLIREIIAACLKSLRPGGIAIFQVPTYMMGYSFRIKEYLAMPRRLNMEMHCLPQRVVFSIAAECGCNILEVREEDSAMRIGRWISNAFVVQRADNHT